MEEKRRFKAEIAGKTYTIVGQRPATHMNTVVEIVNQQIDQLHQLAPDLSQADCCVLMAVNAVSDQLVKEKKILDLEAQLAKYQNEPRLNRIKPASSKN
ncbi:cell division protein ZapA [Vaginisenegalia massiliensis]|uniref:cell division protein ZapA n=1 Tax=Vaginisenegalia massiliensis TaxID=2058294 RepID=UPI000F521377|nr:cell division protein ZapA [Vaginisenegalia massiliensis]